MGDQVGNTEQPSDREPPRYEYVWLVVGVAAVTLAIACCAVDQLTERDFSRGLYSILTGWFVVGGCGWLVRSRETRIMKHNRACADQISRELAEMASAVERLETQVSSARVVHLPQRANGHRYASQAAVGGPDNDTAAFSRTGLDAETIAAARSVAKRLLDDDAG